MLGWTSIVNNRLSGWHASLILTTGVSLWGHSFFWGRGVSVGKRHLTVAEAFLGDGDSFLGRGDSFLGRENLFWEGESLLGGHFHTMCRKWAISAHYLLPLRKNKPKIAHTPSFSSSMCRYRPFFAHNITTLCKIPAFFAHYT